MSESGNQKLPSHPRTHSNRKKGDPDIKHYGNGVAEKTQKHDRQRKTEIETAYRTPKPLSQSRKHSTEELKRKIAKWRISKENGKQLSHHLRASG